MKKNKENAKDILLLYQKQSNSWNQDIVTVVPHLSELQRNSIDG